MDSKCHIETLCRDILALLLYLLSNCQETQPFKRVTNTQKFLLSPLEGWDFNALAGASNRGIKSAEEPVRRHERKHRIASNCCQGDGHRCRRLVAEPSERPALGAPRDCRIPLVRQVQYLRRHSSRSQYCVSEDLYFKLR